MTPLDWAIDGVLAALLLGIAVRLLTGRDLLEATILFIAYGLTLSLVWVRLGAPDIALAEAALGAGVSGALFLNAFQRLTRRPDADAGMGPGARAGPWPAAPAGAPPGAGTPAAEGDSLLIDDGAHDGPLWLRVALGAVGAVAVAGLTVLLVGLPDRPPVLPALVHGSLAGSGATNPVTAVLLNFRAWDTVLELTVVVAAVTAVWSLDRDTRPRSRDPRDRSPDPVLHELTRLVVPLAAVVAIYLAWAGSHRPGGGFQAGALLAGAGVMAEAGGYLPPFSAASRPVRILISFAVFAFLAVGLASMSVTGSFLHYPAGWAHGLMLAVEAGFTVGVTVALVEFFVDVPAVPVRDPAVERVDPTGDPLGRMLDRDDLGEGP
ncbi:MAG: hydrogen gas-evolving membrane-bound hydrogenase subunit E [Longimicrobiales bacterium]